MDISGEYPFDVPPHTVWNALQDPKVLEAVLPGGRDFKEIGENEYTGTLTVKVGPVQGVFQGNIKLSDFKAPDSYWIDVDGKGTAGIVRASGRLRLETRASKTYLKYAGKAQVGGNIASVGQRLMENAARSIILQSLEALNEYLKNQQPQPGAASSASTFSQSPSSATTNPSYPKRIIAEDTPPAQAPIKENESGSDLNSLLPMRYLPWLIGAIIVIVIILLLISRG